MTATEPQALGTIDLFAPITAHHVRNSAPLPALSSLGGAQLIDPTAIRLADLPPEWEAIPDLILAQLAPQAVRRVQNPDGTSYLVDMTGTITPEQRAIIERVARSRWFVMRNDGPALDRAVCTRCGRKHPYLTLGCVERPFHGLQEIVGMIETYAAEGKAVERVLTSIRLGAIVPITRKQARQLADKIRAKGIRFYAAHEFERGF